METEEEFEEYVKGLDENIEEVTTCLAENQNGDKEHGMVITVGGKDVVLLQSGLEEIISYLESFPVNEEQ